MSVAEYDEHKYEEEKKYDYKPEIKTDGNYSPEYYEGDYEKNADEKTKPKEQEVKKKPEEYEYDGYDYDKNKEPQKDTKITIPGK